jgi:TolA protein
LDEIFAPATVEMLQQALFRQAKLHLGIRFQDLYRTMHREEILQHAYQRCRIQGKGAPGADGQSYADIEAYGVDRWLRELALTLAEHRYRPDALLRLSLPQPNGKTRILDIPSVRDRVCMSAAMLLIEPIFAADGVVIVSDSKKTQLPADYADRVGPDLGHRLAGISSTAVIGALAARIADLDLLKLFKMWLEFPVVQDLGNHRGPVLTATAGRNQGIPLDLPVSPLLIGIFARQFSLDGPHIGRSDALNKRPAATTISPQAPVPAVGKSSRPRQPHHMGRALLLSVILHLALLAIQFGDTGSGLPLLGWSDAHRSASVPILTAVLHDRIPAPVTTPSAVPAQVSNAVQRATADRPAMKLVMPMASIVATVGETPVPAKMPALGTEVISTEAASTWSKPLTGATVEENAGNAELARATVQERIEQERLDNAARIEHDQEEQKQAVLVKEKEIAAANLAADALAAQRADELARIERERQKLALEEKAREEAATREDQALARQAALEAAAQAAAAERARAAERVRAAAASIARDDVADAARLDTPGSLESGRDLDAHALDGVRYSPASFLARNSAEPAPARRASILGRDPRDVQLAFYGEGWRQKVERIGSLNYPKLSKFLAYDPVVVKVSINSDGSLSGVNISKSSGHKELDDAVRRIIEMSAPFAAFPPALKHSYDVIDITRTWVFVDNRARITGD